ncbi:MAG: HNH endonuclease signature motif containing protein [Desulfovibrionaceae bacterium]|nr:HNH endonuclease signature motif containing protein [Desulfovibrionaceae bacterium]
MSFYPNFEIGQIISHKQLYTTFQCRNMGGMRRSNRLNCLVLISDHTKGFYEDKWFGNELHYTGEGKFGDQKISRQNKTLYYSKDNDIEVHLFEVFKRGEYVYQGIFELSNTPYEDIQKDINGEERIVWVFPIKSKQLNTYISEKIYKENIAEKLKTIKHISFEELKKLAQNNSSKKVSTRTVVTNISERNVTIAEYAKRRANGVCQLCGQQAPFVDKMGSPYLESHHIIWLSNGGEDSIMNTVALCPNCHRKIHILNNKEDSEKLKKVAESYSNDIE